MTDPWNLTEAQRMQLREAHAGAKRATPAPRTKAGLRAAYTKARAAYAAGELFTNEYALHLDTMLSDYFGLPLIDPPKDVD